MITSLAFMLATALAATPCESLKSVPLADTTITAAELVPEGPAPQRGGGAARGAGPAGRGAAPAAGRGAAPAQPPAMIPAHCRVTMVLKPTTDSHINVELWLPAQNWNGKFMGVGNGGWAGSIQGLNNDMPAALRLGYATAGTDTGHSSVDGPEGMFALGHPQKIIDFAYRAVHEMTQKSKLLVKAFYDENARYSYFKGCSTGGREAMMEAQRYPEDYDAIIAGSLANRHIHMHTAGVARSVEASRHPEANVSDVQAEMVTQAVMKACDTLHEGFLNDPRQCTFNFSSLLCKGEDAGTCLTKPQVETVEKFYGGTKTKKGESIFSGQALGNPMRASRGYTQPPTGGAFDTVRILGFQDEKYDWHNFDLDRDMKTIDDKVGFVDSVNPDLSRFKAHGGKLLLTHGWADTTITPEGTVYYYESVLNKMGQDQGNWMRLFMAPGMAHCGGGPGVNTFDSIGTIEKWREEGIAPDQMIGSNAQTGLKRPICAYPQSAEYKGSGDLKDAANWVCKAP
jgi:feruloyl esterase